MFLSTGHVRVAALWAYPTALLATRQIPTDYSPTGDDSPQILASITLCGCTPPVAPANIVPPTKAFLHCHCSPYHMLYHPPHHHHHPCALLACSLLQPGGEISIMSEAVDPTLMNPASAAEKRLQQQLEVRTAYQQPRANMHDVPPPTTHIYLAVRVWLQRLLKVPARECLQCICYLPQCTP
jgi:hypothetical protein